MTSQNERLAALTNRDDYEDDHKEIFVELVKEKFHKIIELFDEKSPHNWKYYFKGNTATKGSDDFDDGIKTFNKIKSGEMKLEEAKNLPNL